MTTSTKAPGIKGEVADFNMEAATAVAKEIEATGAEAVAVRMDSAPSRR
jgi:hypothetical protein